MNHVIPSILVDSKEEFETRLQSIDGAAPMIQVDILDHSLFEESNWFNANEVAAMRPKSEIELHLMVNNPLPIVEDWVREVDTTARAIVHAEMDHDLTSVLAEIRDTHHLQTGIAVNPETPLASIENHLEEIDVLLIMGVHPGASGQTFLGDSVFEKIHEAKVRNPNLTIAIDGGVTADLIPPLLEAGVNNICAASAIFGQNDPKGALKELQELVSTNS